MENMLLPVLLNGKIQDLAEKDHILLPFLKVTESLQYLLAEEEKRDVAVTIVNKELLLLQGRILENRQNFLFNANCRTIEEYRKEFGSLPSLVIAIEDLASLLKEDEDGEAEKILLFLLRKGKDMGIHVAAGSSESLPPSLEALFCKE